MIRQSAPPDPDLVLGRASAPAAPPTPPPPIVHARRVPEAPPDPAAFIPVVRKAPAAAAEFEPRAVSIDDPTAMFNGLRELVEAEAERAPETRTSPEIRAALSVPFSGL